MYAEGKQYQYQKDEQWLLDGDCRICRRKNYCKRKCTIRSRREELSMRRLIRRLLRGE